MNTFFPTSLLCFIRFTR